MATLEVLMPLTQHAENHIADAPADPLLTMQLMALTNLQVQGACCLTVQALIQSWYETADRQALTSVYRGAAS